MVTVFLILFLVHPGLKHPDQMSQSKKARPGSDCLPHNCDAPVG